MAIRLETAKNYLVSVAERTVGINAYRRWQRYADQFDNSPTDPAKEMKRHRRYTGVFLGVGQLVLPAATNAIARLWNEHVIEGKRESSWSRMARYNTVQPIMDGTPLYLSFVIAASYNSPLEFVAWKLAANAATHVALDLGGAVIKRIKSFRPSATTLTI